MAYERKTVVYGLGPTIMTSSSVVNSTQFSPNVIFIPDQSATCLQAVAYLTQAHGNSGRAITEECLRVSVNGGADASISFSHNSGCSTDGERMGPFDFTEQVRNLLSATLSLSIGFRHQASSAANGLGILVGGQVFLTIGYNDQSPRQIKTAIIPIRKDIEVASLERTESTIGFLPALTGANGILCESGVSLKHLSVLYNAHGHSRAARSLPYKICLRLEGEATQSFSEILTAGSSTLRGNPLTFISTLGFDQNSDVPFFGSTVSLSAGIAAQFWAMGLAFATYEFSLSGTTRVLNSAAYPFFKPGDSTYIDGTSNSSRSYSLDIPIRVAEPGAITVMHSGLMVYYTMGSIPNPTRKKLRIGSSEITLSNNFAAPTIEGFPFQWPVGNSAGYGTMISLSYGINPVTFTLVDYGATAQVMRDIAISGILWVNYQSDVPMSGIGTATHVLMGGFSKPQANTGNSTAYGVHTSPVDSWVPMPDYYRVLGVGCQMMDCRESGTSNYRLSVYLGYMPGEGGGRKYHRGSVFALNSNDNATYRNVIDLTDAYKRTPFIDSDRAALEITRSAHFHTTRSQGSGSGDFTAYYPCLIVCYESVHDVEDRTLTGFSGDGSGIEVLTFQKETNQLVYRTTTSANGRYQVKIPVAGTFFDYARESGTRVGASDDYSA